MYRDDLAATHARLEQIQRELVEAQSHQVTDQQRIAALTAQLTATQQALQRLGGAMRFGAYVIPPRGTTILVLGILALGALGPEAWRAALAEHGPGCPFRAVTGVDCPFCGMTRATLALGAGDLRAALALHPLAPVVVLGTLALMAVVALGRADA